MTVEPVALFPDDPALAHWRQRRDAPLVTVRCERGKRRCDRLAFVYETDGPAVVVFYLHRPSQPATFAPGAAKALQGDPRFKKLDVQAGTGLTVARKDERGTVVILDDERWLDVVTVGCLHHLGTVRIDRDELLRAARRARETARTQQLGVARPD